MILTVTPNPALDVTYRVPRLVPGGVVKADRVYRRAGGKGVNVARVLHSLGVPTLAVLPVGGSDGRAVVEELDSSGLAYQTVEVAGPTRRTVTVVSTADSTETLVSEPGEPPSDVEWAALLDVVRGRIGEASVLVSSGSLPPGAPVDAHAQLLALAAEHGVPSVLDTSGEPLLAGLAGRPAVVKPNADELRQVIGSDEPLRAMEMLRDAGAGAVVASFGARGMMARCADGTWLATPSRSLTGNATGAGDAAVAGIAEALAGGTPDWPGLLRRVVALSASAVLGPLAGDIDHAYLEAELPAVTVEEIG
ncbi:1-phosphofructokinase family hexose kinase [Amycolatopsis suaedae]|uniref:1-phosphofructokinase n=1 Tax=Amycolatopsis suaedae TaxID=2510978 RepID=A0A4Q7J415_9PSEU|nr:hexose kinase [Amycolatopsis suaedae]RZQ61727.1 1-phosphofructokinase [Amycolatopsis suaedae]